MLADMWQLTAASEAAVGVLGAATDNTDSLAAVLEELLSLAVMPDCLLPVFEQSWEALLGEYSELAAVPEHQLPLFGQVLMHKYCDLEGVWGPEGGSAQDSLLGLPLYAMKILLASDGLQVRGDLRTDMQFQAS